MKSLWWGACVAGCVVAFSGCSSTGKWISAAEVVEFNALRGMHQEDEKKIVALEGDKELLTYQVQALKESNEDKAKLLALMEANLKEAQRGVPSGENGPTFTPSARGVVATMAGDLLFKSGEAALTSSGEKVLDKIVELWRDKPNKLAICGFTDSAPIVRTKGKWEDNFDLSGHRALMVLHYLEKHGIAPARMHFEGYGEYSLKPEGAAAGHEDKAKSRRAEIILLNPIPGEASVTSETPPAGPTHPKPKPKPKEPMTPK